MSPEVLDRISLEKLWWRYFGFAPPTKNYTTAWLRQLPFDDIVEVLNYAGSLLQKGDVPEEALGRLVSSLVKKKSEKLYGISSAEKQR